MEFERLEALIPAQVPRNIPLLQRLMQNYYAHYSKQVFNFYKSRASISKSLCRSVWKGTLRSDSVLSQTSGRKKGANGRVIVKSAISADDPAWTPIVVF